MLFQPYFEFLIKTKVAAKMVTVAVAIKYTPSCREISTAGKIFSKYSNMSKTRGTGSINLPPPLHPFKYGGSVALSECYVLEHVSNVSIG